MSDWSDDYSNTDLSGGISTDAQGNTQDWGGTITAAGADYGSVAASLGIEYVFQGSSTNVLSGGESFESNQATVGDIGGVKAGSGPVAGKAWWDSISKWAQGEKGMTTLATLFAGGLSGLASGKRAQQGADALTLNAQSNAARVAEEQRQFNIKSANASAVPNIKDAFKIPAATKRVGLIAGHRTPQPAQATA